MSARICVTVYAMKMLLITSDSSILAGKKSEFWYLLQELRLHWDRIDVICPRPDQSSEGSLPPRDGSDFSAKKRGEVYFHPYPNSWTGQSRWIVQMGQKLHEQYGFDLISVQVQFPFYGSAGARKLACKLSVPLVVDALRVAKYLGPVSGLDAIGQSIWRTHLSSLMRHAAGMRTVNSDMRESLVAWGVDADKVQVFPLFRVDGELLRQTPAPPVAYDVAYAGEIAPDKGLRALMEAIALIHNGRALLIGDGPYREELEDVIEKLGLEGRVTITGWMPTKEAVIGALKSARMYVMNSKNELGPLALLEAMGSGIPAVACKVGIVSDVVEEGVNGLLTSGKPIDIAHKIQELLEDEERRLQMGAKAADIATEYDYAQAVKRYSDYLQSLVSDQQGADANHTGQDGANDAEHPGTQDADVEHTLSDDQ